METEKINKCKWFVVVTLGGVTKPPEVEPLLDARDGDGTMNLVIILSLSEPAIPCARCEV